RVEDRRQPDRVDAERLEVVELLLDSLEVAAEEVTVEDAGRARVLDRLVPRLVDRRLRVPVEDGTAGGRAVPTVVVRLVAVTEAVGEDLVDDRALEPRRRREVRRVDGELEAVASCPGRRARAALARVVAAVVVAVPVRPSRRADAERVLEDHRTRWGAVGDGPEGATPAHRHLAADAPAAGR